MTIEYKLSWEMPSPHVCNSYEQLNGKDVWQRFPWDQLVLDWHEKSIVFTGNERIGQYHQLKTWAETHEQPIRNVRLEQREVLPSNVGWEQVTI